MKKFTYRHALALFAASCLLTTQSAWAWAPQQITYDDIATFPATGLNYERVPSARDAIFEAIKQQPTYEFNDVVLTPLKSRGAPGIALFDYDNDGDLDIYVTNGPGQPNSLFSNQIAETGTLTFVDVGATSGAGLTSQDSSGVCVGDIDNDGDEDMYVLGSSVPNALLENQGNGTFVDITSTSATALGNAGSVSCAMGDINGDGLLDIWVGNAFDMSFQAAIFVDPFAYNEHNHLLKNNGNNTFADISVSSGARNTTAFDPAADGQPTISWAVAMYDYDGDGDLDLIQGDDQAGIPFIVSGNPFAQDRGFIQIYQNDGQGNFTNKTLEAGTNRTGQWMGLALGDVNCDGNVDIFGSNFGDYTAEGLEPGYPIGRSTSRFLLSNGNGTFADPGNSLVDGASVFGWGTSMFDYDNDGDLDIIYHGGMDLGPYVDVSNPGVMLENEGNCSGNFKYNAQATSSTNHYRRNVHGVAIGDLDEDGFDDVVSVANFDITPTTPIINVGLNYNSPFDAAGFVPVFVPTATPGVFVFNNITFPNGSISVELSSANNRNKSAKIQLRGSVGTLPNGKVNRNGVGATVSFTPKNGNTVSRPMLAGSSYASTDSKTLTFGLGRKNKGTVEVTWPGNVKNRLYNVRKNDNVTIPEIPCSYDDSTITDHQYKQCVRTALNRLKQQGVISNRMKGKLLSSALRARRNP